MFPVRLPNPSDVEVPSPPVIPKIFPPRPVPVDAPNDVPNSEGADVAG